MSLLESRMGVLITFFFLLRCQSLRWSGNSMPVLKPEISTAFTTDDNGPCPHQNNSCQILTPIFFKHTFYSDVNLAVRTAQAVQPLAAGRRSNLGAGVILYAIQTGPDVHPASCRVGARSFQGIKWSERGTDHSPLSSAGLRTVRCYTPPAQACQAVACTVQACFFHMVCSVKVSRLNVSTNFSSFRCLLHGPPVTPFLIFKPY